MKALLAVPLATAMLIATAPAQAQSAEAWRFKAGLIDKTWRLGEIEPVE